MASLNEDYKLSFSANLFFLCKYSLGMSLTGRELMIFAKDFEFTNNNYIRKNPELFLQILTKNIKEKYDLDEVSSQKLISSSAFKKLPSVEETIFANVSISKISLI